MTKMPEPNKPDTYTLSSGEAAKAELRELREVAEGMAAALERIANSSGDTVPSYVLIWAGNALVRYEALRDG